MQEIDYAARLAAAEAEIQNLKGKFDAVAKLAVEDEAEYQANKASMIRTIQILLEELQAARRANVRG